MASSRGMSVGTRVLVDSLYLASVRYVGPVTNHTGIYLGVEYDDPSRGRLFVSTPLVEGQASLRPFHGPARREHGAAQRSES